MDTFSEALLCEKTDKIPESFDWFAPLLGDWDCDYYDEYVKGEKRHVKGEWIFRRVLEGTGIHDIFIFPSRATKEAEPQPDGEYGSSLRMFNKNKEWYYIDARGITTSFDEFMDIARNFVHDEYIIRPVSDNDIIEWNNDYYYDKEALAFAEAIIKKYNNYYAL